MHVGYALPTAPETLGGGFTFEHELLDALLPLMPSASHSFSLIGQRETWEDRFGRDVRFVPLPDSPPRPRGIERAVRRGLAKFRVRGQPPAIDDAVTSLLDGQGIEAMLYINPWSIVSTEIPYLTFVWDLEHRVQPYFPELARNGGWDGREKHFRRVLPRASAIVTGTAEGKQQIERCYGIHSDRILTLPHPTPADVLAFAAANRGHTERRPNTLLYPAQFWPHKNHIGLLHAMRLLRDRDGLRVHLLLTGTDYGGHRAHVQASAERLGLASQVEILGFVPRRRLLQLLTEVSLLVYPTTFGPENLPPLEAFALGCPVVTSRFAGSEEQFGDAALFFCLHDDASLADAIRAGLTDDKVRRDLTSKGRERARAWTGMDVASGILRWLDAFALVRRLWR